MARVIDDREYVRQTIFSLEVDLPDAEDMPLGNIAKSISSPAKTNKKNPTIIAGVITRISMSLDNSVNFIQAQISFHVHKMVIMLYPSLQATTSKYDMY